MPFTQLVSLLFHLVLTLSTAYIGTTREARMAASPVTTLTEGLRRASLPGLRVSECVCIYVCMYVCMYAVCEEGYRVPD